MNVQVKLFEGHLHYGPDVVLYTASSGSVPYLDELYLVFESERGVVALGGIRINVEYLTGIPKDEIKEQVIDWLSTANLGGEYSDLLDRLHHEFSHAPPCCESVLEIY